MTFTDARPYGAEATYRRMHRTTVVTSMVSIIPVGVILIAVQSRSLWEAAVLGVGFVAAVAVLTQWGRSGWPRFGTAALVICAAVWAVGAVLFEASMAFFPLALVGSMTVPRLLRHRAAAIVGFGLLTAGIGAANVWRNPELSLLEFAVMPGGIAVFATAMMLYSDRYWVLFHELERAREAEAELGIMRERVRFASDLHDIQGHTLHVVKLKVALAEKLVEQDPARSSQELREVHELVGETITQTKELAYAQRRLNLSSELENAKNLFEAAGIQVEVLRWGADEQETAPHVELLGQALRETTTNILRHAQASRVEITLGANSITVTNDGAEGEGQPALRGLETLGRRVADRGGQLRGHRQDGRFTTVADFSEEDR